MLSIVVIAKTGTFTKDGINQYLAKHLPTIQSRDNKPRPLSAIQIAKKVNDGYEAVLMAATVEGDTAHDMPSRTLFIAVGSEFGIGELCPVTNFFVQNLQCYGWVKYQSHHGDMDCVSFRTMCSAKISEKIMTDGNYTSLHLSEKE